MNINKITKTTEIINFYNSFFKIKFINFIFIFNLSTNYVKTPKIN